MNSNNPALGLAFLVLIYCVVRYIVHSILHRDLRRHEEQLKLEKKLRERRKEVDDAKRDYEEAKSRALHEPPDTPPSAS